MKYTDLVYTSPEQQKLYSGKWVDEHPAAENKVTCFKCFKVYKIKDAPRTIPGTDGYYIKEPQCPGCGCRLYYSHLTEKE